MTPTPVGPNHRGILIVGTMPQCGKTLVTAGIAGALAEMGFPVHALKPMTFTRSEIPKPQHDQVFLNLMTRVLHPPEIIQVDTPEGLSVMLWNRMIEQMRNMPYPVLLEAPGSVASPLRYQQDDHHSLTVIDIVDLSRLLEMPIVLVTPQTPELIAQLAPALAYLWNRSAEVLGWIAVATDATQPESDYSIGHWDKQCQLINREYQTPHLGTVPYSPSISIPRLQQGNLIRACESSLDLFPIQQTLNFSFV